MRFSVLCLLSFLFACSPKTAYRLSPAPPESKITTSGKSSVAPKVDLLFVIDNSGSMDSHQLNLRNNVDRFVGIMEKNRILNFQIGAITTDNVGQGPGRGGWLFPGGNSLGGRPFVKRGDKDLSQRLREIMKPGILGSSTEKFFDPLKLALTEPVLSGFNKGFYRPEATLALFLITDTEDQSALLNPDEFYAFLLGLKGGDERRVLTYGAYVDAKASAAGCPNDDEQNGRLETFFKISRSKVFGLCDPNFGDNFGKVADDIVAKVAKYVYLDRIPDLKSITVRYGDQEIPEGAVTGWIYEPELNAIVLGDKIVYTEQDDDTVVEVDYIPLDLPQTGF